MSVVVVDDDLACFQGMDFSRVQARGVSKILLKGQRYTAPPNMKTVSMEERWRWTHASGHMCAQPFDPKKTHLPFICCRFLLTISFPPLGISMGKNEVFGDKYDWTLEDLRLRFSFVGGREYLDASALFIGPTGDLVEVLDYCHTVSQKTRILGAATHSGDTWADNLTEGVHRIQIRLDQLGPQVRACHASPAHLLALYRFAWGAIAGCCQNGPGPFSVSVTSP
jgi:hypothetical protein